MSRTVVVTGAGSGIGQAIAAAFSRLGDRVYGCDISADRLATIGADITPVVLDVSDEAAVQHTIRDAAEQTGRLDVLVNNAGVADGKPDFVDVTTELWNRVLDINLNGTFYAAREAARIMRPSRHGRIINIASTSTFSGRGNGAPYTTSKAAVFGLTQRMAYELGPHGITVNAVLPGAITTSIGATTPEVLGEAFPDVSRPLMSEETLADLVPVGRRGTPEEVAVAAVFLASDEASYLNGVTLPVDGGMLAA